MLLSLFCLRNTLFRPLFTAFCVICATTHLCGQPAPASDVVPHSTAGNPDAAPPVSTTPPAAVPPPAVSTTPPKSNAGDSTISIDADGENTYIGDIATADNNVVVRYQGDVIFADHIVYDRATRILIATGNARIFSGTRVYRGDSITYNLDTKAITSAVYKAADYPRFLAGQQVTTPDFNHYHLTNATFTTSNRQNPSFRFKASTIEYRPNDEVVLKNIVVLRRRCAGLLLPDTRAVADRFAPDLSV